MIVAGQHIKFNLHCAKQKFFRSVNAIFSKIVSLRNPTVALSLMQSFCVPILLYAQEALHLKKCDVDKLDYAYNSMFVKIFNVKENQSILQCQFYSGYLPASYLIDLRILTFFDH